MLLQGESSRGSIDKSHGFVSREQVKAPSKELTDKPYLWTKLFLWRCRSPEAMSHASRCRSNGSGGSGSLCRQLCR